MNDGRKFVQAEVYCEDEKGPKVVALEVQSRDLLDLRRHPSFPPHAYKVRFHDVEVIHHQLDILGVIELKTEWRKTNSSPFIWLSGTYCTVEQLAHAVGPTVASYWKKQHIDAVVITDRIHAFGKGDVMPPPVQAAASPIVLHGLPLSPGKHPSPAPADGNPAP